MWTHHSLRHTYDRVRNDLRAPKVSDISAQIISRRRFGSTLNWEDGDASEEGMNRDKNIALETNRAACNTQLGGCMT